MKVLIINAVPYGSTGRIMFSLADKLKENGHNVLCTSGFTWVSSKREDFFITSNIVEKYVHTVLAKFTGRNGQFSHIATRNLLKVIENFKPDVIHLHNIHGWFVNLSMLFSYIKEHNIPVIWTLHDCWSFTGHCPHYTMVNCEKWKSLCHSCQLYKKYPQSFFDNAKKMFIFKKKQFTGVKNLTIVTPSRWLQNQVKCSFLNSYQIQVINNGIDLNKFCLEKDRSSTDLKEKYVILGVSYDWNEKKGLDVFCELSELLPDKYEIILIGTNDRIDKDLPKKIVSKHRTQNQQELAKLYRQADVFVNPTREDNFPTVNMEALACGTPVITFDTGGSPEIVDEMSGSVVPVNDIEKMKEEIIRVCETKPYTSENCRRRAEKFSNEIFLEKYMKLYEETIVERVTENTV